MRLRTWTTLGVSLAAGYVLGAAAGRGRYQQITATAGRLVHHPKVQEVVFELADRAKAGSHRLPGTAARLVDRAADWLEDEMTDPRHDTD